MANEIKGIRVNGVPYKVNYPDLANRAFGEEKVITYFPEQTVAFYDDGYGWYISDNIAENSALGKLIKGYYRVTIDSKAYLTYYMYGDELVLYDPTISTDGSFFGMTVNVYGDNIYFTFNFYGSGGN